MLIRMNRQAFRTNFGPHRPEPDPPHSAPDNGGGGGEPTETPSYQSEGSRDYDYGGFDGHSPSPAPSDSQRMANLLQSGETDPDRPLNDDDLKFLLGFDAIGQPGAKKAQPAAAAPAQPAQPATPAQPAAPAEPKIPVSPDVAALTGAVQQLIQTRAPENAPAQPANQPQEPQSFYGGITDALEVNPAIVTALLGPDAPPQAVQAVNSLVNGIGNRLMQDNARILRQAMSAMNQHVQQAIAAHTTARETQTKFYGKHADLNTPGLQPMVNEVFNGLLQEKLKANPNFQINDAFYDDVARVTRLYFKKKYGFDIPGSQAATVQAAPVVTATPAPKPRFQTNGGGGAPAGHHPRRNGHESADPNHPSNILKALM